MTVRRLQQQRFDAREDSKTITIHGSWTWDCSSALLFMDPGPGTVLTNPRVSIPYLVLKRICFEEL